MARDIDLIAAPWIEGAVSAHTLALWIASRVGGWFSKPTCSHRPHGRVAYSIHFPENPHVYLDLSIMPLLSKE